MDRRQPAYIPQVYLPGEIERLKISKRALRAAPGEAKAILEELERLSGPPPQPVKNLFAMLELRAEARRKRVAGIAESEKAVELRWHADAPPRPEDIARWLAAFGARVSFVPSSEGDAVRLLLGEQDAISAVRAFLQA